MPILKIPDIIEAMKAFDHRVHPDEAAVSQATNDWLSSYEIMPAEPWKKFVKCKIGLFTAMSYPDASTERLRVTSDFMSILFSYDDLMDLPGNFMRDKIGADKAAKIMMSVVTHPEEFQPVLGMPIASAFHDWWTRFCKIATPGMKKRFIETLFEHIAAARNQTGNRQIGICPSIEAYCTLRKDTSAVKPSYLFVEFCIGKDVPDAVYHHPGLEAMHDLGNEIISYANDIYSFDAEHALGDYHNLVAVSAIQRGITVQKAIDLIFGVVKSSVARYFDEKKYLPSFGPDIDPVTQEYVKALDVFVTGAVFWHLECERYFGPNVEQVKETLTLETRPPAPGIKHDFTLIFDKSLEVGAKLLLNESYVRGGNLVTVQN